VRPQRVLTVHGFAREFAAELRTRGIDAWCAMGNDQLELAIVQNSLNDLDLAEEASKYKSPQT
jgi:hypothetical protein